jgi:AMP nucleosidase
LDDPSLFNALDEGGWDLRGKKLFLFSPERMALSLDRLGHYCGTPPEAFQRYLLFTNYAMHVEAFLEQFPDAEGPERAVQMPAWHHRREGGDGVTIVNIGVGPPNAKTVTDHLAVLRPDAMVMIGHCGGLRNHQDIGDFVLATGYLRADHILDDVLPCSVPVIPNPRLNALLLAALEARSARFRMGVVYTTDNRNWELNQQSALEAMRLSRSVAVDMESATVAANGFRYRIPNATLLSVSDKPLHGSPKLEAGSLEFYEATRRDHLALALECLDQVRRLYPDGIPNADLRSTDEPLFGAPPDVD